MLFASMKKLRNCKIKNPKLEIKMLYFRCPGLVYVLENSPKKMLSDILPFNKLVTFFCYYCIRSTCRPNK